jgi:hypothetical protein
MPKIDIVNAKNIIESNPEKAFFKLKNTGGPKGDTGAQGPQGPKGDTGAQGPAGASASVTVGSTTTLSPGADATVTNSGDTRNAILNFGIPTGAQGPQGIQGPKGDTGPMGQTGAKGDTGAAATVQVGNTNTGAPGTNAQVTNAGNEHFAVFNFTIPRGDKGETGATGAQGDKGDKGDKGDTGQAATIEVGSTTTTNPGTSATVTNSGTSSAAVLNFGIPRGATGSVKSEVVSELPETGEGDTFYLVNREATTQTATGKTINFTNSENTGYVTDAQIDGETSQNGTPTPDAPVPVQTVTGENVVKICGKNLWGGTIELGGIKISDGADDGATDRVRTKEYVSVEANTEYAVSGIYGSRYAIFYDSNKSFLGYELATNRATQGTFTTVQNTRYVRWYVIPIGTSPDTSIKEQLELGSTATAYEPYQGQSYEVNLGKNLFDKNNYADQTGYYIGGGGIWRSGGAADHYFVFSVEPNTTYTFSKNAQTSNNRFRVGISSGAPTVGVAFPIWGGSDTATEITLTTASDSKYAYVYYSVTVNVQEAIQSLQIEVGSQKTSYAAYFEPIELCKIGDYQDYIYKSGDKWYVRKEVGKITLSGSENWVAWGTGGMYRYYTNSFSSQIAGLPQTVSALSDYFRFAGVASGNLDDGKFFFNMSSGTPGANGNITFNTSTIATVADWKTWLGSHNTTIYYQLDNPTEEEITNEALVGQLDNVASAPLYTGVNNITTITPNEQGTLEIKYVTYDKYNQNKVYIWNDTLQQWQIIVQ